MQTAFPLVNESQLGTRLNEAVVHDRRGEFALLLSMLSIDARDMAQFQWDKALEQAALLRKRFELPASAPLLADLSADAPVVDNSRVFSSQGQTAFRLQQALTPEATLIRGRDTMAMTQVLANCDHYTRLRHRNTAPLPEVAEPHLVEQLAQQRRLAKMI
jgi:hypothetical protein